MKNFLILLLLFLSTLVSVKAITITNCVVTGDPGPTGVVGTCYENPAGFGGFRTWTNATTKVWYPGGEGASWNLQYLENPEYSFWEGGDTIGTDPQGTYSALYMATGNPIVTWATEEIEVNHHWYVATNGTGTGTNWADATNDLQGAITACASNYIVWVSNGTYIANLTLNAGTTVRSINNNPAEVTICGAYPAVTNRVITGASRENNFLIGLTITNGYAIGNWSTGPGGGVAYCAISNCIIMNNYSAFQGGGVYFSIIHNSTIASNFALTCGGARDCVIYNSLVTVNSASNEWGGAGGIGYGNIFYNCEITSNSFGFCGYLNQYYNCTVANNSHPSIASIFVNSISWNNGGEDSFPEWAICYYSNSCGVAFTNIGSITTDPFFVSSTDLRLQSSSPCKDTGTNDGWVGLSNSVDMGGKDRIYNLIVDMGAYEYYPADTNNMVKLYGIYINKLYGVMVNKLYGR